MATPIAQEPIHNQIMRLAAGVLSAMIDTPDGAEVCVAALRRQGWRCEPPEAQTAAPKKRTRRKEG